ncbi:MAG TPA: hypothetical protein VF538_13235 [Pyrinomonadaceae bacterium]|jgi:hypothetical protein
MSKRISRAARSPLAALALCAGLLVNLAPRASAQASAQQAPAKPAVSARAAALAAETEEVMRETSELRKLPVLSAVKSGAQSRAEIEQMLLRSLDEESKPEELRAGELTMKKLGLIPADFGLRAFTVSVLTEQILGYYDPKTRQFYLADWVDLDGQQPVLAHELTHALQDQHFDLRRFEHWRKGDADAEFAAKALVEGDAMFLMTLYVMKDPRRIINMMKSVSATSTAKIDAAPRALRESIIFPYDQGMAWVRQLHQRGGWKAVDDAYARLPQSTEQIIHPEKYFAREGPARVAPRDLTPALGRDWKQIDADVNGEWGYYLILDQFLKDEKESKRAAAGWGGDRYALYENQKTRETLLAQDTVWDTEQDAQEFLDAYAKRTELRYKTQPDTGGLRPSPLRRAWHTPEGIAAVERRGARVITLEGLPPTQNAARLAELLWR